MENASKALIIAGGILVTVLIVTILVYAWSLFSEYQASREELANIQDTTEFNMQFTNFDRDNVLGYELLSLLNKIVDYNERRTNDTEHGNDDQYPAVRITITLDAEDDEYTNRKKLVYNDTIQLFDSNMYIDEDLTKVNVTASGKKRKSFKRDVESKINNLAAELNIYDETILTNMAKNIKTMFKTQKEIEDEARVLKDPSPEGEAVKKVMVTSFNSYLKDYKLEYKTEHYNMLILKDVKRTFNKG